MAEQPGGPRPHFPPEEPKGNLASNILAIVGFIILIVVVIWGLVNLASLSRGWFSSFFGSRGAAIEVTAPETAIAGTPFTLSWKYDEPVPGTYALLYPCASGLSLQAPGARGSVGIPCGAAFTLAGTEKKLPLTPYLSGVAEKDVALSVIFLPSATSTSSGEPTKRAEGSATVRVSPLASATPTPSPSPSSPSTGSGQVTPTPTPSSPSTGSGQAAPAPAPTPAPSAIPATPADLSVRIISVSVDASGNGTAIFDIANIGGSSSGTYYFTANLPTQSAYTYSSPAQSSLAPQAHITSTLRFSQAGSGMFGVSISTIDTNGSNNYASQSVNAPYYYQYGSSGYPYSPYAQGFGGTQQYYPAYSQYQSPTPYYYQQNPYGAYYPYVY